MEQISRQHRRALERGYLMSRARIGISKPYVPGKYRPHHGKNVRYVKIDSGILRIRVSSIRT